MDATNAIRSSPHTPPKLRLIWYLLDHPELETRIPEGAYVVLLPEDDPELCEYNRQISEREQVPEQPMVYIRLGALLPEQRSRLADVRIEPMSVS